MSSWQKVVSEDGKSREVLTSRDNALEEKLRRRLRESTLLKAEMVAKAGGVAPDTKEPENRNCDGADRGL